VLTSYHVVADASTITLGNQKFNQLRARLVYSNPLLDMAVLKVSEDGFEGFPNVPFSLRRSVADPGEKVYTLGYPREDLVFGEGSVSSYTGYDGDTSAYQISIPVNPGNSGGPLFDSQGHLAGIISGRNSSAEGASFAVKSKWIVEDIRTNLKINLPSRNSLKGLERSAQVKRLRDHVFMVKVTN
jgi:serine protease Do